MSIPRYVVRVADGSRVPQLTVKLADGLTPAQCTLRVAESGERAQYTIKIADGDQTPQMTVILENYAAASYADRVLALSPIAYYQLGEASGTTATDSSGNGYDGSYVNATPGGAGIGDGQTGATFDGTGDAINIAAMRAAFTGNAGSILLWGKTAAWADSTARYLARFFVNASNRIAISKDSVDNTLVFERVAGGATKNIASTVLAGSSAYFSACLTWDTGANALKAYVNGVQVGTTQTSIGTFTGTPGATTCAIGASGSGGANSWSGAIAHVAIFDRALTDAEILSLGVL